MRRRTLLQMLAAVVTVPFSRLRLFATQSVPDLTDSDQATLLAIAEVGLPSALGPDGRAAVVRDFTGWVRDYRQGAERGHGYGSSALRRPSGHSPALRYPDQFAALDAAARSEGASSFVALAPEQRRVIVERHLNEPSPVARLSATPTGDNLIADFLGYYFNSPDAWDLCYEAAIGSDRCRSLAGSDRPPAPLGGR